MQLRCLITVVKIKQPTYLLFNWAISGLFLVVFVHFKQLYRIKTIEFSGIQTRIVVVEGKHADHLTTALYLPSLHIMSWLDIA